MWISPQGQKEARPLANITNGSILEAGRATKSGDELGAKRTDSMGRPLTLYIRSNIALDDVVKIVRSNEIVYACHRRGAIREMGQPYRGGPIIITWRISPPHLSRVYDDSHPWK
jgi:hypothetical protein